MSVYLQPCDWLLGKGSPLGSVLCDVLLCFVTFPCGILGQVWYLILLIPCLMVLSFIHLHILLYLNLILILKHYIFHNYTKYFK